MRRALLLPMAVLTGCSATGGPYPSLQPRPAEAIDPRLQPVRPINDRPVAAALAARLVSLVAQARAGESAFAPAMTEAERLAAQAGAPQSEGWIAAQQALTAAIAARRPTTEAQADIDALAATDLQSNGGIAPNDLKAIENAASQVAAISHGQTNRIEAVKRRLGS